MTEWNEFKQLDWEKLRRFMRRPVVVDGRNLYEHAEMAGRGFIYWGVGRGAQPAPTAAVDVDAVVVG